MGKTKLGISMVKMYEEMIQADFQPLIIRLEARTRGIEPALEKQVKKDLGVYELFAEKAAHETRLKEIERELEKLGMETYQRNSNIRNEMQARLKVLNEPLEQVKASRDNLIRQIKMSGVGADVKAVFDAVPGVLEDLGKKFGKLPAITEKQVKKLAVPGGILKDGDYMECED
jgi:hypothetical protein